MDTTNSIFKQFKKARKEKQYSQTRLSNESGVNRSTIWRFERGGDIKMSTFLSMISVVGCRLIIIDKDQ